MKYFYTNKDADFSNSSIRAIYEDTEKLLIEYNEGEICESWQEITLDDIIAEYGDNPLEREPIPEPTEQEIIQAEMLLNQIEIMSRQNEQDEVLAEILLNQLGV